jgi:hypothetical protein
VNRKNFLWGIICAAAAIALAWYGLNAASTPAQRSEVADAASPAPGYTDNCYYNWATRSLPELSNKAETAISEVHPGAQVHAETFGEYCIHPDGHAEFLARETDFQVTVPVSGLGDESELGSVVRTIMDVLIERFPSEQTPGAQSGRVTFLFQSLEGERSLVVPVSEYQQLEAGMAGGEVFKAFLEKP